MQQSSITITVVPHSAFDGGLTVNSSIIFLCDKNHPTPQPTQDTEESERCWTHNNGLFWPRDLLMPLVPSARIILFSYKDAVDDCDPDEFICTLANCLLWGLSSQRLKPCEGHRPIIFVSHSTNGLIVKYALMLAKLFHDHDSSDDIDGSECLHASTYGLVNFAVPHSCGQRIAMVPNVLGLVMRRLRIMDENPWLRDYFVDQMKRFGPDSGRMTECFKAQAFEYETLTFAETRPTKVYVHGPKFLKGKTSMVSRPNETVANMLAEDYSSSCTLQTP